MITFIIKSVYHPKNVPPVAPRKALLGWGAGINPRPPPPKPPPEALDPLREALDPPLELIDPPLLELLPRGTFFAEPLLNLYEENLFPLSPPYLQHFILHLIFTI